MTGSAEPPADLGNRPNPGERSHASAEPPAGAPSSPGPRPLLLAGRPWLGVNFWSRSGGPLMWRNYDADLVRDELRELREHNINLTRSFFYWPDFMPAPDRIDDKLTGHYADFLDAHADAGMATIPTFIVGHMSGENWDPDWRQGRDLYGDIWMVARQAWFVREMTSRYADHPAVAAWLITNEMPIYGELAPTEQVSAWAQLMVQAVRAAGGTQPVSIGDGAWGIEVTGVDNGFSVRELAEITDFVGPHVYPMGDDQVRQNLTAAFACELARVGQRPVVLEEFGVTDNFVSATNAAHYYRQVLHNTLLAGATGWIAWNNTDYDDLPDQDPYRHHAFEMYFGLTDAAGRPKPQLVEIKAFGDLLDQVDLPGLFRPTPDTALVVSSYLEQQYPFTQAEDRTMLAATLRQAYVAAREADVPVDVARERDGLPERSLYLVPSTRQLTVPTWRSLELRAYDGATVYVSYCAGITDVQRGPWYADLDGMFGVEHQLAYGLVDPIEDDEVVVTFQHDFGSIAAGDMLTFRVGGNPNSRAYLPVRPVDASVIAVDQHDRAVLLEHRTGAGRTILCTYPLEHMAAVTPRVNPEPTYRLYDALAAVAGVHRTVTIDDPRVLTAEMHHHDGRRFVWLVSQARDELSVTPIADEQLVTAAGTPVEEVRLAPFGVQVLSLPRL